jgi:hypothetical protein
MAQKEVHTNPGILAFDDVVVDKSRSGKTELVNWQYSGAEHDIMKGIGVLIALWKTSKEQHVPHLERETINAATLYATVEQVAHDPTYRKHMHASNRYAPLAATSVRQKPS